MTTASYELRQRAEAYVAKHGLLYSPVRHPDLADLPSMHGPERFELIRPHIPRDAITALDIGAHWGFFSGLLEEAGLDVTAVELDANSVWFLKEIANISGKRFRVIEGSALEVDLPQCDVVLALNIFHHFLKKKAIFEKFALMLQQIQCRIMFFQPHHVDEDQMVAAYRNFHPEEFCAFIVEHSNLTGWQEIGQVGRRKLFKLT